MDDEDSFDHGYQVGGSARLCEVINIIETGIGEGFTDREIIEAVETYARDVVEDYVELGDEIDTDGMPGPEDLH